MKRYFILACIAGFFLSCNTANRLISVNVNNPSSVDRGNEMVEIQWDSIVSKIPDAENRQIVVLNSAQQQIPYQVITEGTERNVKLIFPVTVKAGENVVFQIKTGTPEAFAPIVYGRFVPERKDDFAWENNRAAFRVYGPALESGGEISNGMDFWTKRTDSLVIDKWYKNDLAGVASYHKDNGEGLDFYKVGRTLGLGMTAPFANDTLCLGKNFTEYEILDNGPLRITFRLSYKPYDAGGKTVAETRVISLDAYSNLNKVINTFETDSASSDMQLATGIVTVQGVPAVTFTEPQNGIMAYELPTDTVNGTIYTGVINPAGFSEIKTSQNHLLGINPYKAGNAYVYYAGGGWNKGSFKNFDEWTTYLKQQKAKIDRPLQIELK